MLRGTHSTLTLTPVLFFCLSMKSYSRLAIVLIGIFLLTSEIEANEEKITEQVHDVVTNSVDGFVQPLASLATIGEKLNVLIRIKKDSSYEAGLVFVERQDWPEEKQRRLRELYTGHGHGENFGRPGVSPYPIKLRFQLDSVEALVPVHVDVIHEQRKLTYGTYYPHRYPKLPNGRSSVIWRAQGLWGIRSLEPGVYRLRVENLSPCPEIDFETLLQFYVNHRKV